MAETSILWCPVHESTYGAVVFGTELMCSTALLIDTEEICIRQQAKVQVTLKQIMPLQKVVAGLLHRMKAIEEGRAEDSSWKFPTFAGEIDWLLTAMGEEDENG